jgi:soluble lytic murein transglycosylase-like protein
MDALVCRIYQRLMRARRKPEAVAAVKSVADQIDIIATRHGLDPLLVSAIVQVESGGNQWAMRYEPHFEWITDDRPKGVSAATEIEQQRTSWGLMQVMGATARDLGCDAPFLSVLCSPSVGLEYGCRYLARQLERYGSEVEAVAAYNAGSVRRSGDEFVNQSYVDKVWRVYSRLRGDVA